MRSTGRERLRFGARLFLSSMLLAGATLALGRPARADTNSYHVFFPAIAHQGEDPVPPPPPPPPPRALDRCYAPRPEVAEFPLLPANENSIFRSCQIVTYYGYPDVPALGVLGEFR